MNEINRNRLEVTSVFLRIGALGYGPAAIWGLIQAEVQERRTWLTKERYLEGMALVNVLPGATAMQMCIFVGHERAGWWGGVLAGLAFMAPAFAIMLALSVLSASYGALPLMRDAFYGLGPVVLGIFIVAIWRLGRTVIKDLASAIIALVAAAAAAFSLVGVAGILLLAGCAGVALHHSRRQGLYAALAALCLVAAERFAESLLAGGAAAGSGQAGLWDIAIFFFKVGALTFGGGMSIVAFVQDQVVNHLHWISAQEFIECLTLSQFTPGPIIMVAAYVGYRIAGIAGASVAAFAIFLPSFILMLSILPVLDRVRRLAWVKAAMKGITPAVVGAIGVTIIQLLPHAAPDLFTGVLLALTVIALLAWRLPVLSVAVCGGLIGIVARSRLVQRLVS
jgi:chromate transporter